VGSHLLIVVSRENTFEDVRVDVTADSATGLETVEAWTTWRGNEWSNKGESRTSGEIKGGKARLEVKAVAAKDYYVQRQGCKFRLTNTLKIKTNLISFDYINLQQPNDSHWYLHDGNGRWHAMAYGQP
jgi:hypothetical protein